MQLGLLLVTHASHDLDLPLIISGRFIHVPNNVVKMCFLNQFAIIWNNLPKEIKLKPTVNSFKNLIIKFFYIL